MCVFNLYRLHSDVTVEQVKFATINIRTITSSVGNQGCTVNHDIHHTSLVKSSITMSGKMILDGGIDPEFAVNHKAVSFTDALYIGAL